MSLAYFLQHGVDFGGFRTFPPKLWVFDDGLAEFIGLSLINVAVQVLDPESPQPRNVPPHRGTVTPPEE